VSLRQRILLLGGAIFTLSLGLWIALQTQLPSRAAFTGYMIAEVGLVAPEINAQAPPFSLTTVNGTPITLEDLRGQPVILNFWATWCVPCRVEMPILQRFYERHGESGVQVLAVNLGEHASAIEAWAQEMQLTYPLLLDPQLTLAQRYHLRGQPSTYIIGPEGVISHIFYGPFTEEALTRALEDHLPG
jgi:peroxiredoxin